MSTQISREYYTALKQAQSRIEGACNDLGKILDALKTLNHPFVESCMWARNYLDDALRVIKNTRAERRFVSYKPPPRGRH